MSWFGDALSAVGNGMAAAVDAVAGEGTSTAVGVGVANALGQDVSISEPSEKQGDSNLHGLDHQMNVSDPAILVMPKEAIPDPRKK